MITSIAEAATGVGVIGAGVMGGFHARLFHAQIGGARLVGLCDPDPGRARALGLGVPVFEDGLALIRDDRVEAVLVAAPDEAHHPLVMEALRLGKPVLCEKPLAATVAQCREIVARDDGRGLVSTGFMRRFDPSYCALRDELDSGRIGAPLVVYCRHRNQTAPGWFRGAMILTNAMVHEIDICRWLLGAEYTRARITELGGRGDLMLVELQTDIGVLVSIEVFMNAAYGYHIQTELVGRAGSLSMAEPAPLRLRQDGAARASYPADWIGRFAQSYQLQDQAWITGLRGGAASPLASGQDGLRATGYCAQLVALLQRGGEGELQALS